MHKRDEKNAAANALIRRIFHDVRGHILLIMLGRVLQSVFYLVFVIASRDLIDCATSGDKDGLIRSALILSGLTLFRIFFNYGFNVFISTTIRRENMKLRVKMYEEILRKKQQSLSEYHSTVLLERLTSDLPDVVSYPLETIPSLAGTLSGLCGAVWALFTMNKLLLAVLLVTGALFCGVGRLFKRRIKDHYKDYAATSEQAIAYYQESLGNSLMLKVFRALPQARGRAHAFEDTLYGKWRRWFLFNQVLRVGSGTFFQLGYLLAMIFCAALLLLGGVSFGSMTAILQLVSEIQGPFSSISDIISARYYAQAAAERVLEITDLPAEQDDEAADGWAVYEKMRSLDVTDLSFGYGADRQVLTGATASLNKGDFVVVTGQSGGGKSTLFQLLLGVYERFTGRIELSLTDGTRLPLDERTRALFSYVPQKHMVFSGTVRDNLCFLCGQADDEQIWRAARLADAEDFLRKLPEGLDTKLGELGQGLSEGQAQRLAIARALLKRAPILILDEATSALDEETEERVLANIRAQGDITLLIISHRRAAYAICDREWHLRDGLIEGRVLAH